MHGISQLVSLCSKTSQCLRIYNLPINCISGNKRVKRCRYSYEVHECNRCGFKKWPSIPKYLHLRSPYIYVCVYICHTLVNIIVLTREYKNCETKPMNTVKIYRRQNI